MMEMMRTIVPGRHVFACTFGIVTAVLIARDAVACSCARPGPPCEAAWTADAVFSGTVLSIEQNDQDRAPYPFRRVRLSVQRGFIDAPLGTVEIGTGMGGGDCGYAFKVGVQYLVYAWKDPSSGRLGTGICSRTKALAEAGEDLRYLTSIPATGTGGQVFGRVNELKRDPAEHETVDYGPVEGFTVSVRSGAFARDAVTGTDGTFNITGVPVGKAIFTASVPSGFEPRGWETEFEIRDPRTCHQMDLSIQQSATASGTVVDAAGKPMKGVKVDAVAEELAGFNPGCEIENAAIFGSLAC